MTPNWSGGIHCQRRHDGDNVNILFYQKKPGLNSTMLNWTLAEELRLLGHSVVFLDDVNLDKLPEKTFDWVRGGGENAMAAVEFARRHGARVHIHAEGVGYWRVGADSAKNWGFDQEIPEKAVRKWKDDYRSWMDALFLADTCSINGARQKQVIESNLYSGRKIPNCYLLSCGVDARYAATIPAQPKYNIMITCSRIAENKRIFKIAEAVAMVDPAIRPQWLICGFGPSDTVKRLETFLRDRGVAHAIQPMYGAQKWLWIKRSRLMLCGWNGIPPAEGMVCDIPVVSFDHPDIVELFSDTLFYAADHDPVAYAAAISWIVNRQNKGIPVGDRYTPAYPKTQLLAGDLYACTQTQLAKKYDMIFREHKK